MIPYGYLLSQKNIKTDLFVIRLRAQKDWYYSTIELYDPKPVVWTSQITKAKIFISDEHVEEFKFHFLHDRACDIIRIK